jgi:hypothetical protein
MTGQNKKQNKVQSKSNVRNAADGIFERNFRNFGNALQICDGRDLEAETFI